MTIFNNHEKSVAIKCECGNEVMEFSVYDFKNIETSYEFSILDKYRYPEYSGIKGRFRRAWSAFTGKPVYWGSVTVDSKDDVKAFFKECIRLIGEKD